MNLEKKCGNQNQIRMLITDGKEIDCDVGIFKKLKVSMKYFFKSQPFKNVSEIEKFLCGITTVSQQRSNKSLRERLI